MLWVMGKGVNRLLGFPGDEERGLLWNLRILQDPPINLHQISANHALSMPTASVRNGNLKHHSIALGDANVGRKALPAASYLVPRREKRGF